MSISEKLLKYVSYDTQADANSKSVPSTLKQLELAKELAKECEKLADEVILEPTGTVYVTLNATCQNKQAIGFVAHMDTATELPGKNVKPRIIKNYQLDTIVLNEQYSMHPDDFENLKKAKNQDIIVTDGNTLLGADDKAGIAICMQVLEEIQSLPHGKVMFAFTCDEEVGKGTDHFDLSKFPVAFAYTVDGADINHIDYETFNAAGAHITIHGTSIHPGEAKGKMVNACLLATEFISKLPILETPQHTENREGFYHVVDLKADVDQADIDLIIRDHDFEIFTKRKEFIQKLVDTFNEKYTNRFEVNIKDQYYNMARFIKDDTCIQKAKKAIEKEGLIAKSIPVRGGTDGANLTQMGLVCPNLGTGSYNHHGRYEFASIQQMEMMVRIVKNIILD